MSKGVLCKRRFINSSHTNASSVPQQPSFMVDVQRTNGTAVRNNMLTVTVQKTFHELENNSHTWQNTTTLSPIGPDGYGDTASLPREMVFNDDSLLSVIAYSVLFIIAAFGNLTVFITLFRNRHRRSRVNLFIMHLSVADLIVTFVMLPLETAWHITVSWLAGDIGCRLLMFCRAFGFYLSSFILVAISLDRYFAIIHPMSLKDADQRGRIMLALAWLFSVVSSIPQSVIFHVEKHPQYHWFTQCITFNFFPTPHHELAYNLFNAITLYGLPLVIISIAYSLILCEITRKAREHRELAQRRNDINFMRGRLRRSAIGNIQKAKIRTLKMTIVIVLVFVMCWTPYFVISAWWWFDKKSAQKLNPKVQRGLFIFAVSNSCMDPIVYGMFSTDLFREFSIIRCCLRSQTATKSPLSANLNRNDSIPLTNSSSSSYKCNSILDRKRRYATSECIRPDTGRSVHKSPIKSASSSGREAINDFTRTP